MAGYSDNRELNMDIKYLRKVLSTVDDRIVVPKTLSGDALRKKIDHIPEPLPRQPINWRRVFSPQSGVAYAAAFVLIIALVHSVERYSPSAVERSLTIPSHTEEQQPADLSSQAQLASEPETEAVNPLVAADPAEDIQTPDNAVSPYGIGGSGKAELLLNQGEYAYYFRMNDETDPDKQDIPLTVEVVDSAGLLTAQIDIPDMHNIYACFVENDTLLLVGQGDGGLVLRGYNNADPAAPVQVLEETQPGTYVDARVYDGIAHVLSVTEQKPAGIASTDLAYAQAEDGCVITAMDMAAFAVSQEAFVGLDGTVSLHNLSAYIHYEGTNEAGEPEQYIAQVLFDGIEMELDTAESLS